MALIVEGLIKRFGSVAAVDGVSFTIEPGEMLCLLGPSGCGKTNTLRCVAGLETPDAGTIRLDGQMLADGARGILVPPHRRRFGMVFQSYAVWPHLMVCENVRYPLRFGSERETPCAWFDWRSTRNGFPISCPVGNSSASPWPAPW